MAISFCRFLILVNHANVAIFNVAKLSFYAFRENKILVKISEVTVFSILRTENEGYFNDKKNNIAQHKHNSNS